MALVAYCIRCDCGNQTVLQESKIEESLWNVSSKSNHTGDCPECNAAVSDEAIENAHETREDDEEMVPFTEIDGVGESVKDSFHRKNIETKGDLRRASDAKLLEVNGVGQSKVDGIRGYIE